MSPGSIVFSGIGHWMSPIFQPGGSFHFSSVFPGRFGQGLVVQQQPAASRAANKQTISTQFA
jgi:hypothetical protein